MLKVEWNVSWIRILMMGLVVGVLYGLWMAQPGQASSGLLFSDDFESSDLSQTTNGFVWTNSNQAEVTSEVVRSGDHSLRFSYTGNPNQPTNATAEQRFDLGDEYDELWVEYWVYFPDGTEGYGPSYQHRYPGNNLSEHRIFELNGSADNQFRLGVRAVTELNVDGDNRYYPIWTQPHNGSMLSGQGADDINPALHDEWRGQWVQFRMHYRISEQENDSTVRMWVDGELEMDNTSLNAGHPTTGEAIFSKGALMGLARNGFDADTVMYVDDFSVYSEDPAWDGTGLPIASFTHSPHTNIEVGTPVAFTDTSADSEGTITEWAWDFGDQNTSTAQHPVHAYQQSGTYTVSLRVTNDQQETSELFAVNIHVEADNGGNGVLFYDDFSSGDAT